MVSEEEALMKKKQLITIIILCLLVAAMVTGYVIVKNDRVKRDEAKQAEEEAKNATIALFDIATENIEKIAYTYENETVNMYNNAGEWVQEDTFVPLNPDNVQAMLDAISSVVAIKVVTEDTTNLAEYGLDKPVISYVIELADGSSHNIKLGSSIATEESAYYALVDDEAKVYSVSGNYYEPFAKSLVDMTKIVDEININADYITEVEVNNGDYRFAAEYIGDKSEKEYYTWKITSPYQNIYADTDRWKPYLSDIAALSYDSCVAYNTDSYKEYGLEKAKTTIRIKYYTAPENDDQAAEAPVPEEDRKYEELILNIGNLEVGEDEYSSYYYVRQEGSSNIYTLSISKISSICNIEAYQVADACIYSELVDSVRGYEIEYGSTKLTVERRDEKPEETPDPKKKKDTINVYYVNGQKVDEDAALDLYSFAYLLTYTGEVNDDKADSTAEPALTITYHPNDGDDVVVKFIPYDGNNFYQVDKNGIDYFLTDKRGVDTLIDKYDSFIKDNKIQL